MFLFPGSTRKGPGRPTHVVGGRGGNKRRESNAKPSRTLLRFVEPPTGAYYTIGLSSDTTHFFGDFAAIWRILASFGVSRRSPAHPPRGNCPVAGEGDAMADRSESTLSPARAALDSEACFDALVARSHDRVRRLAGRLLGWRGDVDDVVQDVFLAVFEHRARLGEIRDRERWLTTIALNVCRRKQRRSSVWRACLGWLGKGIESGCGAASDGEVDETRDRVRRAVAALPRTSREVIVLRYLEGLEVGEIAALLSVRVDAVAARLSRARVQLREALPEFAAEAGALAPRSVIK